MSYHKMISMVDFEQDVEKAVQTANLYKSMKKSKSKTTALKAAETDKKSDFQDSQNKEDDQIKEGNKSSKEQLSNYDPTSGRVSTNRPNATQFDNDAQLLNSIQNLLNDLPKEYTTGPISYAANPATNFSISSPSRPEAIRRGQKLNQRSVEKALKITTAIKEDRSFIDSQPTESVIQSTQRSEKLQSCQIKDESKGILKTASPSIQKTERTQKQEGQAENLLNHSSVMTLQKSLNLSVEINPKNVPVENLPAYPCQFFQTVNSLQQTAQPSVAQSRFNNSANRRTQVTAQFNGNLTSFKRTDQNWMKTEKQYTMTQQSRHSKDCRMPLTVQNLYRDPSEAIGQLNLMNTPQKSYPRPVRTQTFNPYQRSTRENQAPSPYKCTGIDLNTSGQIAEYQRDQRELVYRQKYKIEQAAAILLN